MRYLKSLFFNFLIVFFANHVLPGIEVTDLTKLPHLGGDLLFSLALGLLNTLVYPILRLFMRPASIVRIAIACFVLNFIAYAIVKFLPVGIHISSIEGYLLGASVVALGSILLNYADMKSGSHHHKHEDPVEPPPLP